jgi:hypothetical protein
MLKKLILSLALAAAAPAVAAQTPASPQSAEVPPPDAARIAAAERFVTLVFPAGTMQRALNVGMGLNMDAIFDLPAPPTPGQAEGTAEGGATLSEVMTARDPHFRERMRITSEVTNRIMGELFTEIEPEFRAAMVELFARRFTTAELNEMNVFFAAPTGQKYALMAPSMMSDPAIVRAMMAMMPRMMAAMPRITAEIASATAHLPPPPEAQGDDDEEEPSTDPSS